MQLKLVEGQNVIGKIMRGLHTNHWDQINSQPFNPDAPVVYYEETRFKNSPYKVPVVVLRSNPCQWFVQGGCVMCNYMGEAGSKDGHVTSEQLLKQVDWVIENLGPLDQYPYMVITTAGSLLSPHEMDSETRLEMLRRLRKAGLKCLAFESEAKYCSDPELLGSLQEAFEGPLSVGIGLESSDDYIRNVLLNKGLSKATYTRAVEALKCQSINFVNYVLLGKPFLHDREDVSDAVETIRFAIENGASNVVMLVTNVQQNTLVHWLWEHNKYKPTSLWSAISVLRQLPPEIRVKVAVKGFDKASPEPLAFAHNCELCNSRIVDAIEQWNYVRDSSLLDEVWQSCSCWDDWNEKFNREYPDDKYERISAGLLEVSAAREKQIRE